MKSQSSGSNLQHELVDRTNACKPVAKFRRLGSSTSSSNNHDSCHDDDDENATQQSPPPQQRQDCTRTVIRTLTQPLVHPPKTQELHDTLLIPWSICIPLDGAHDYTMRHHWQRQAQTPLYQRMFDWHPAPDIPTADNASLYFSLGDSSSPFFAPWQDVGKALKELVWHQVASRHQGGGGGNDGGHVVLSCWDLDVFVATAGPQWEDQSNDSATTMFHKVLHTQWERPPHPDYYLLRCHYDKAGQRLVFGYHQYAPPATSNQNKSAHTDEDRGFATFHPTVDISLHDDNWRLTTCIVLTNLARILHCLKDYAVPLVWKNSSKLHLVHQNNGRRAVQKVYHGDTICPQIKATVHNMVAIYQQMAQARVPHVDCLVSVVRHADKGSTTRTTCQFTPVGRAYQPLDWNELLDALVCVAEALVALHALNIMHRDIRWANVMHVLDASSSEPTTCNADTTVFTREWILFDFEFAAKSPQPAVPHLTATNHAPEMLDRAESFQHDTAVDIWGLGYLMQQAMVDIPASHAANFAALQTACLHSDPTQRPTAVECLNELQRFQAMPASHELDFVRATEK